MATPTDGSGFKQIRFVNNEGQPPAKRRRINAACRTCRKRKTRCDGRKPLCSTCTDNGHECLGYSDGPENAATPASSEDAPVSREDSRKTKTVNCSGGQNPERIAKNTGSDGHTQVHRSIDPIPELRRERAQPHGYLEAGFHTDSPSSRPRTGGKQKGPGSTFVEYRESAIFSDQGPSPLERSPPPRTDNHRVPYFRYFGPTAIVPGFKQMVVSVREHRRSTGAGSSITMSPGGSTYSGSARSAPSQSGDERRPAVDMPIYDPNDPLTVNRLIVHLVETFFAHLGSNYPFLHQKSFIRRVEEKSMEPILVDAVCALAARFSDHPLLIGLHDSSYPKSEYGHAFAQRAKAAVVETFPCPTVAAVQACLLLAYEGFGANQDSALWMYLGCAIRMAVDLGLQKLDGVRHQGQKDPGYHRSSNDTAASDSPPPITAAEMKEVEQERIDTLWAVFMLDRVISSGTGRPVTLRDEDFELSFPDVTANNASGWPNPFPALIQIIHLYGRVSDLLNNIRGVKDVTTKKIEGLSGMEKELTLLYQQLDQRLNFNAANFQHYVRTGEGTNFILLHFWFHTLIMLLHQPTLMHSFEGQIIQLLPNSRELSMSSAKTIADILAFAELIDPRSFIGNPFTSQPMYVAACAFLMETAAHTSSQPTSRDASPPQQAGRVKDRAIGDSKNRETSEVKGKHSLLAAAANQNYQRCYKALQQLEIYWAGTRYILVALDQKAKGIWDPETYTEQEYESTKTKPDSPNWQRLSLAAHTPQLGELNSPRFKIPRSPQIDPSQAIGWSLTGTTNSPSSSLTFMYQNMTNEQQAQLPPAGNMIYDPIRQSLPEAASGSTSTSYPPKYPLSSYQIHRKPMPPPPAKYGTPLATDSASTQDAEMLLGLQNSPFSHTTPNSRPFDHAPSGQVTSSNAVGAHTSPGFPYASGHGLSGPGSWGSMGGLGRDMMMESQEIDMSSLGALGGDMMPWLEYLPHGVLNYFDGNGGSGGNVGNAGHGGMELGSGAGPTG